MNEPIDGPEDWRELAKLPVEELRGQLLDLRQRRNDESEAEWIRVMRVMPRVMALSSHLRGKVFAECALPVTGYRRTLCSKIVASGIADLDILTQIWERVRFEAHAAELRGVVYRYPGLWRMLGWYRPAEPPAKDRSLLTEEERRILDEIEPYWRRDQQRRNNDRPPQTKD